MRRGRGRWLLFSGEWGGVRNEEGEREVAAVCWGVGGG